MINIPSPCLLHKIFISIEYVSLNIYYNKPMIDATVRSQFYFTAGSL